MKHQLRDIEYFSEIAERGNVGRAVEALGLSQPALSKSLRRLEKSMQAKLVKRLSRGIELTAVGRELYSHVHRLRLSLDDMTRAVTDLSQGRTGHLRIRTGPGFASHVVPAACAELLKDAPDVTFNVSVMAGRDNALSLLRNGELDFVTSAIHTSIDKDLAGEHLFDEEFVVYASADHRLARKKRITLFDLTQEKWAVSTAYDSAPQYLRQAFLKAKLPPPHITMESSSLLVRNLLLTHSDVLSFTSTRAVREAEQHHRLVELRVAELTYIRSIGVYYRKDGYLPPVAKRFIEVLKKTAGEIDAGKH